MAEDTRKSSPGNNGQPFDPQKGAEKTGHWRPRLLVHKPGEDPKALKEAKKEASWIEAAKTIEPKDFSHFHKMPCVRDALLPAIGAGVGAGAVRFIVGGAVFAACTWSVGTFSLVAGSAYAICQRRRRIDKEGIAQVIKVIDQKESMKHVTKRVQAIEAKGKQVPKASSQTPKSSKSDEPQRPTFWSTFKFW